MAQKVEELTSRAAKAVTAYEQHFRNFQRMAQHVHDTIRDRCPASVVHNIEYRAKDPEKFRQKCIRVEDGEPKYADPLNEITDLAGVRVIVFVRETVADVCRIIGEIYEMVEQEDVGERVYQQGRFGYQSVHLLVNLDKRMYLGQERKIKKAVCEIQVRTILQHAWAEMEHDIQYKGQVPLEIAKRFSALAGLLEIADWEFQRIQADSLRLKESVHAKLVDDLTQQGLVEHSGNQGTGETANVQRVRQLVASGRYSEALEWYNQKIAAEPNSHTPLIGRAKLLFLMGYSAKALQDLANAERLSPADPVIARTRSIIESGDADTLREQGSGGNYDAAKIKAGFEALEAGDGVRAFNEFTELETSGYNKAFAAFNKSMACTLESDFDGAIDFLSSFKVIPTTPMSVNLRVIHYVIRRLRGEDASKQMEEIKKAHAFVPHFSVQQSHVHHLLRGLRVRRPQEADAIIGELQFLGEVE